MSDETFLNATVWWGHDSSVYIRLACLEGISG